MNHIYSAELARALFEEVGDALFLFDPDTDELLDVNRPAERLSGFPRAELLSFPATYLFRFGGGGCRGGKDQLRQAATKTQVFHSQEGFFLRTRQDGVWVPVNLTVARLHVRPKTLALITARDVGERHEALGRLQRVEAELRRVLASVSDCLWSAEFSAGGSWEYRYFSPVVEQLTGRPPESFLGKPGPWEDIVHPDDRPAREGVLAALRSGQPGKAEYRVVWPDGRVRWLRESVRVTRGPDGRPAQMHGVLTDTTELKQAEQDRDRFFTLSLDMLCIAGLDGRSWPSSTPTTTRPPGPSWSRCPPAPTWYPSRTATAARTARTAGCCGRRRGSATSG